MFSTPSDIQHDVIRLSPDSAPTKSSEMSQQQKISAALLKAGLASPDGLGGGWSASADLAHSSGVLVMPDSTTRIPRKSEWLPGECQRRESETGFDPHPPVVLMKGSQQQDFPDLLAQPAGSCPLAWLEMHADDLGRPGAGTHQPLLLLRHQEIVLVVSQMMAHHASNPAVQRFGQVQPFPSSTINP